MDIFMQRRTSAFTLVEITVVLGVVVLFAALLFGVMMRTRAKAQSLQCQSQLKQIALAIHQYVQDSDSHFPSEAYIIGKDTLAAKRFGWDDAITPYVKEKSVFWCPSNGLRDKHFPSYGYNFRELNTLRYKAGWRPKHNEFVGANESQLLSPAEVVLNQDSWALYGDGVLVDGSGIRTGCGTDGTVGTLHLGGANASFVDGHVKWFRGSAVSILTGNASKTAVSYYRPSF